MVRHWIEGNYAYHITSHACAIVPQSSEILPPLLTGIPKAQLAHPPLRHCIIAFVIYTTDCSVMITALSTSLPCHWPPNRTH